MTPDRDCVRLDAPVAEVTLLEDRAHVVRRGRVTLPPGSSRLRVEDVAPVLSDKTLSARFLAAGADTAIIRGARVERGARVRQQDRPPELVAIEQELEALEDQLAHWQALLDGQQQALSALETLSRQALTESGEDAAWGRPVEPAELRERLQQCVAAETVERREVLALEERIEQGERKAADLRQRLQADANPSDDLTAAILLELDCDRDAGYELEIDYIVPGACWRPHHCAEIDASEETLHFRTDACVWQRTGEDWRDVALHFSTRRPSLGSQPPQLASDELRTCKKVEEIQVATREQEIRTTGLGAAVATTSDLPGIDDGGDARSLSASAVADVPSDGQAYRVALFEFEQPTRVERVVMAELAPWTLFKTEQGNSAPNPILAGPVDLIRYGGLVGRGQLGFVAPGERFALGWGPDASVRVHRDVFEREEESGLLGSWHTRHCGVDLHLSNLGPESCSLEVCERIPVSEVEKVKVVPDLDQTSENRSPDDDGFLRWSVALSAFGRETFRLRYALKHHKDVTGI